MAGVGLAAPRGMPPLCTLVAVTQATALQCWYAAVPAILAALWTVGWLRGDRPLRRLRWGELVAGLILGALVGCLGSDPPPGSLAGRHVVDGRVGRVRCGTERCVAELEQARARPLGSARDVAGGLRVRAWSDDAWVPGERVRALMGLGPPRVYRNPGMETALGFSPLSTGGASAVRVLESSPLRRGLEAARTHVRTRLTEWTAPRAVGIARALVLGESGALDESQRGLVRGAGLAHLVAVSGLHMALLAGLWHRLALALARRTRWAARWPAERLAAAAGLLMLPGAVLFAGGAPSAVRAGLTAGLGWALVCLGRRPDPVTVGCATVLLCLGFAPGLARQPGFLLSIAATAALLSPRRSDLEAVVGLRPRLAGLRDSARTWLATLPVALAAFGSASPWALVSNLLGVPFASLLWVPLALLHALCASLHPWLARCSAPGFELACDLLLWACAQLPALPGASEGTRAAPGAFALAAFAAVVALWGEGRLRFAIAAAALLTAFGVQRAAHPWPGAGELEVTFLDVGQGDAAVLRDGDGRVALIDTGGRLHGAGPDPGERAVVPWLRAHGVQRIDLVVLSHPHPDHVGGLPAVLEAFDVAEIWDTGQAVDEAPDGTLARWLQQAREAGTRVRGPPELCGGPQRLGEAWLRVLAPCPAHDPGHGPNDNSFVLELSHGARRFLFPGDAERAQEAGLLADGVLRGVDVLKVGHHGSRTSSHADFLAALDPALAVVSCGRHNPFGHPHPSALGRLRQAVRHVWRIDRLGGVQVRSDGQRLEARAFEPDASLSLGVR